MNSSISPLLPASPLARPRGVAALLVGALRVVLVLTLFLFGTPLVLLARSSAPAVAHRLARLLLRIVGVRLHVPEADELARAQGFVFFNHFSFLDSIVLYAVRPMRFLATAGVRRVPLLGQMAEAVGTLFVERGEDASRAQARTDLAKAVRASAAPVALAPEGRIGPGPGVLPLRHGAFETAQAVGAPIHLITLVLTPLNQVRWNKGESLLHPLWRLCARTTPFTATVRLVATLDPAAGTPEALALQAEALFNEALLNVE